MTAAQLLLEANSAIAAFDNTHKNDDNFPSAAENCKDFVSYLWCASKNLIPSLEALADTDDAELISWSKRRHGECIMPTENSSSLGGAPVSSEVI